jgi:S-adenosylmethionine:tRNA ribosyltransferase-isomerase
MKRQSTDDDKQRYQSIWAKELGSSAAPTASLHFTPEVLAALQAKGVQTAFCTLHVGLGTFFPVHHSNLEEHVMHEEWFCVPSQTRQAIAATKKSGHHVVAVGTTVMRALESLPDKSEETYQGTTQLFIKPGFEFRFVDKLLTNFHQVDSTLMLLVQAFAGHDTIDACYKKAIAAKMRFYSYGDCMLLERSI